VRCSEPGIRFAVLILKYRQEVIVGVANYRDTKTLQLFVNASRLVVGTDLQEAVQLLYIRMTSISCMDQ
jgi:hypothetical protein